MNKNGPKHYQNGGHSYDSTPMKESNGNSRYESIESGSNTHPGNGNHSVKRDIGHVTPDVSNPMPLPSNHSPYLPPFMPYVPHDGNVEHPPVYMPVTMFPSPGTYRFSHLDESKSWISTHFCLLIPFLNRLPANAAAGSAKSRSSSNRCAMWIGRIVQQFVCSWLQWTGLWFCSELLGPTTHASFDSHGSIATILAQLEQHQQHIEQCQ